MNDMRTAFSPKLHTLADTNDFAVRAAKCITRERRPRKGEKEGHDHGCAEPLPFDFVVENQLTLQCKISDNKFRSK